MIPKRAAQDVVDDACFLALHQAIGGEVSSAVKTEVWFEMYCVVYGAVYGTTNRVARDGAEDTITRLRS